MATCAAIWRRIGRVVAAEVIAIPTEEIQRPDGFRLVHQRHDDLRCHAGHEFDVARVGREVVDEERLLRRHGGADQPLPELQPERFVAVRIADGVLDLQLVAAIVEQVDGKRFERDQAADENRNLGKEVVQLENRGDLAPEVE